MTRTERLAVIGIAFFALLCRATDAPHVFVDGEVLLYVRDAAYHARRALYTFVRFPEVLWFDPYLRFPDGAPVPFPPLYDWLLGAVARGLGSSERTFELVLAWSSPVLCALTVFPVHAATRRVSGPGVGYAAACLYAIVPAGILQTWVGNPDHHAMVALCVAGYAAAATTIVTTESGLLLRGLALALVRAVLALCWSGSLLFFAVGELALGLGWALAGGRARCATLAASDIGAALLLVPWVAVAPTPLGGPWSATELSWLQPLALASAGGVFAGVAFWESSGSRGAWPSRLARLATSGAVAGVILLLGPMRGLDAGFGFLANRDGWSALESAPLFAGVTRGSVGWWLSTFGWLAWTIPVLPVSLWLGARDRTGGAVLAVWTAALGALALAQVRFANDFAPIAAIALAVSLDLLRRALRKRLPAAAALAIPIVVAALALAPALHRVQGHRLVDAWHALGDEAWNPPGRGHGHRALHRFARRVAETTPPTRGYLEPGAEPEYGVLADPSFGHILAWPGRRATPANNFGPYLSREKMELAFAFQEARREDEALEIVDALGVRYVMTADWRGLAPRTFQALLHRRDGVGRLRHAGHFRLVTESPAGSRPLPDAFPGGGPPDLVPYKLFERVAGARLLVRGEPGEAVEASVALESDAGRPFTFTARTRIDDDGRAMLRLPYATEGPQTTRALGAYAVATGETRTTVSVPERAVLEGAPLSIGAHAAGREREPAN